MCVCVCEREGERECVCVRERGRQTDSMRVRERQGKRERRLNDQRVLSECETMSLAYFGHTRCCNGISQKLKLDCASATRNDKLTLFCCDGCA